MLQASNRNPKVSAYKYIFGQFDLQKTPIAPPGIKSIIHLKPNQHTTFGPRGSKCWYIGLCLQHYRCLKFYLVNGGKRISGTAMLYRHSLSTPQWTQMDAIIEATRNLEKTINNQPPTLYTQLFEAQQEALQNLAEIFKTFNTPCAMHPQPRVPSNMPNMHGQMSVADATQMMQAEPRVVT